MMDRPERRIERRVADKRYRTAVYREEKKGKKCGGFPYIYTA